MDGSNWRRFFPEEGDPTVRLIVEGANSFLTPEARLALQDKGVRDLRDASANKCGVISSSYEIISRISFSRKRSSSPTRKSTWRGVLEILEKRASHEAELILPPVPRGGGEDAVHGDLRGIEPGDQRLVREDLRPFPGEAGPDSQGTVPESVAGPSAVPDPEDLEVPRPCSQPSAEYRAAILAAEIASTIVYRDGFTADFGQDLKAYVSRTFGMQWTGEVGSF